MNKKITYLSEDSGGAKEQLSKLKKKLRQCQKEKEEHLIQAQRARADLVNFRRRQEERMKDIVEGAEVVVVQNFLPVLDSLKAGAEKNKGIEQILHQFQRELIKIGLEEIKAEGEKFNPEFHEAVEQVKSDKKEGIIVEEIQQGYMLGDKVLRVSKVKVVK